MADTNTSKTNGANRGACTGQLNCSCLKSCFAACGAAYPLCNRAANIKALLVLARCKSNNSQDGPHLVSGQAGPACGPPYGMGAGVFDMNTRWGMMLSRDTNHLSGQARPQPKPNKQCSEHTSESLIGAPSCLNSIQPTNHPTARQVEPRDKQYHGEIQHHLL